jgi:nucleotide-binding universal stress UspA family protein
MLNSLIWAMDPFEFESLPRKDVLTEAMRSFQVSPAKIRPVFVCGPDQLENWKEDEGVQKTLAYLKELALPDLEMIPTDSAVRKDQVEELTAFAENKKADLILLTAHGHSAISHFFVGSFAKELLTASPVPMLFLTARAPRNIVPPRKALFVSDFSLHSRKVYQYFLAKMESLLDEVLLYHAIPLPISTLSASAYSGVPAALSEKDINKDILRAQDICESWVNEGRSGHLRIRFHCRVDSSAESFGRKIALAAAEENAGFVALASHELSFQEKLLGSRTEDVFENVNCPVWVCGPEFQIPISASSREISPMV